MTRSPARLATALVVLLLTAVVGASGPATSAPAASPRPAKVRDFVKEWGGHTRYLGVERDAATGDLIATEAVGDGCCHPIIDVTMRLSGVRGSVGHASMRAEVLTVVVHDPGDFTELYPAPQVGDVDRIRIRRNVLHERLTGQIYCDPSSALRWICGA